MRQRSQLGFLQGLLWICRSICEILPSYQYQVFQSMCVKCLSIYLGLFKFLSAIFCGFSDYMFCTTFANFITNYFIIFIDTVKLIIFLQRLLFFIESFTKDCRLKLWRTKIVTNIRKISILAYPLQRAAQAMSHSMPRFFKTQVRVWHTHSFSSDLECQCLVRSCPWYPAEGHTH